MGHRKTGSFPLACRWAWQWHRDNRGLDFFENILPEGAALTTMAALAQVRSADTFGVLAAFGRDCAGAIVVLPEGEASDAGGETGYTPVTDDGLARVIATLDVAPLAASADRGFRPSLAGFQRKALVGRALDGRWAAPVRKCPVYLDTEAGRAAPHGGERGDLPAAREGMRPGRAGDRTAPPRRPGCTRRQAVRPPRLPCSRSGPIKRTAARQPPLRPARSTRSKEGHRSGT